MLPLDAQHHQPHHHKSSKPRNIISRKVGNVPYLLVVRVMMVAKTSSFNHNPCIMGNCSSNSSTAVVSSFSNATTSISSRSIVVLGASGYIGAAVIKVQ